MEDKERIEKLMMPRYEMIADYPGSSYYVGWIIILRESQLNVIKALGNYPHLFRKLAWHERRDKSEMPDYIKWTDPGTKEISFFKVMQWLSNSTGIYVADVEIAHVFIKDIEPATESEYTSFIQNKEKQ